MIAPTSFRLSSATRAQVRDLAAEYNGNQTTALAVAIDRMWRENMDTHTTARVTAAQMIRRYREPQWLVEPIGEPADREDVAAINQQGYEVLDRNIRGWGIYNAIVRVPLACAGDVDYLARLATAPRRNCGHCHTCGTPLRTVLDGEEWCPTCQQYRRYAAHGWAGTTDPDCPSPVTPANEPHGATPASLLAIAEAIYSAVFGDLDDKRFGPAKVQEIYDWLDAGDGGEGRTVEDLAEEWRDLDSEDVLTNADINIEVLEDSDRVLDIEAATGLDGFWDRSPWWEFAHDGVYVDRANSQAEYTEEVYFALRKRWPDARILLHEQESLPGSEHALLVNGSVDHDLAYYVQSEIDQVFARLGDLTVLRHYSIEPCDLAALAALRDQVAEVTERYGAEAEAALLRIDRQPEPIEILCLLPDGRAGVFDAGTEVWLDATSAEDAARHYLGAGIGG